MHTILPFAAKLQFKTSLYYFMLNTADVLTIFSHIAEAVTMVDVFEWAGSLTGLLGAYLLATHSRVSRYGWVAFFIANIAMICFACSIMRTGLLVQQIGFLGSSLLGLKRAGFFGIVEKPPEKLAH